MTLVMTSTLSEHVLDRLQRDAKPKDNWPPLVMAALEGEAALADLLATSRTKPRPTPETAADVSPTARPAYLRSMTVQGFRGIGREPTLELAPGPGLTLVTLRESLCA